MNTIEIAAASVIGREHRRLDRPCQDAVAIRRRGEVAVAVVCDGCGSGAHSELGARLGANLFATALVDRLAAGAALDAAATWWDAAGALLERLGELAPLLVEREGDLAGAVHRHLLFTLLAAAMTPDGAALLAIGDGVLAVDGALEILTAPGDAPAYLGYALLGATPALAPRTAPDARTVLLATDGAAPLAPELARADARLFRNPDALRRRLALASRDDSAIDWERGEVTRTPALLTDDATVAILRRGGAS